MRTALEVCQPATLQTSYQGLSKRFVYEARLDEPMTQKNCIIVYIYNKSLHTSKKLSQTM